jgi:hypothetical protein
LVAALLALLLAAAGGSAQETAVRAEVDAQKIGVQDHLQLTLTLEGRSIDLAGEVELPKLENLRVAGGPSVSTQMSIVNAAISQARIYTWVLQPLAAGTAQVGAFRVPLSSGTRSTAPISVEVVLGSVRPQRRQRAPDPFGGDDPFESIFGRRRRPAAEPQVFVSASLGRERAHVGEPLLLTYSVCTTAQIGMPQPTTMPQYPGFWAEAIEEKEQTIRGEPATVEGVACQRFAFGHRLLFATRSGTLTIPATKFQVPLSRASFFDVGPAALERETAPITVTIDPLPAEPGFSGAVGRFRASAQLDRSNVALGEAATLRFRVEGSGNIKWIDKPPELAVPGAKVYPPQTKSDVRVETKGMSGSKTWEFVVVPETAGALEIPPLSFAYFDPAEGRVLRTQTAALPLEVTGAAGSAAPAAPGVGRRAGAALALRSDLDPPAALLPRFGARTLALVVGCGLVLHALIWGSALLIERRRRTDGRAAPRRGIRAALVELERVGRDGTSKEAAAARIERVLHEVFGPLEDGTGAPPSEREQAARAVLQDVQFIRYAPQLGDYSEKIREVAARAGEVIRRWA